jgi:CRISPR system Cascade subunit CasA
MPSFNLVNTEWLSCLLLPAALDRNSGMAVDSMAITQQFSLKQVLLHASQIRELIGESPPVTIALHRLLLAVLHRCLNGPRDSNEWAHMWRSQTWDIERLTAYLTRWSERFDLFHEQFPFYQTASLDVGRGGTVAQLYFKESATLFDHALDDDPPPLSPAAVARFLITFQSFDVGGIKTAERDKDFAKASPLVQSAVGLVRGQNLFETLMLNLHRYNAEDGDPFKFDPDTDLPAWERDEVTKPVNRYPDGYVDLLTWQSRRIRLQPELDAKGQIVVKRAVMMKGYQFPDNFERYDKELMVPFRKRLRAKEKESPWFAVGFDESKALWRDSLALFQSVAEKQSRPRMLNWLHDLAIERVISRATILPIDFFGFAVDQAKPLFWRHERLLLPLAYLDNPELLTMLGEALTVAEAVAEALRDSLKALARLLLSPQADEPNGRKPDERKDVTPLADSFPSLSQYWSQLESPFKHLMLALPQENQATDSSTYIYDEKALYEWANTLDKAAQESFQQAVNNLSGSARDLKASAKAERHFNQQMGKIRKEHAYLFPTAVPT